MAHLLRFSAETTRYATLGALFAVACGDSDSHVALFDADSGSGGNGGSTTAGGSAGNSSGGSAASVGGGTGGSIGSAGSAGSGATSGSAGSAGTSVGGSGGTAGSSATAGSAGTTTTGGLDGGPPDGGTDASNANTCGIDADGVNGLIDVGEACDLGTSNSDVLPGDCDTVCRTDCTCPRCGDGVTDPGEECDLGGPVAGICDGNCNIVVTSACGDRVLNPSDNEECDDGSHCANGADCTGNAAACASAAECQPRGGDGCSASCQLEPVGGSCGDSSDPNADVDVGAGEKCDDQKQCANGTSCAVDATCSGLGLSDALCLPRNGENCNTTCNFKNEYETFHLTPSNVFTLATDNTYLYTANEGGGELARIDIAACDAALSCNAGPPPTCSTSCTPQVLVSLGNAVSFPASDGNKVWFAVANWQTTSEIYELDVAACDALLGGSTPPPNCNSIATSIAGAAWGHQDGTGTGARFEDIRGLTYYAGKVYSVDGECGTLRELDPGTGVVTTLVGPAVPGASCGGAAGSRNHTAAEGYGQNARLGSPRYMTSDNSGFLYISDNFTHSIWRYNVATTYLEDWVGSGTSGYLDALDGSTAMFARPRDLTSDGTSVYVADFNNFRIRQAEVASGRVTTMIGNGNCGDSWGRGAVGPIGKPFTIAYHHPTRSMFAYTGDGGCGATPQILRIR